MRRLARPGVTGVPRPARREPLDARAGAAGRRRDRLPPGPAGPAAEPSETRLLGVSFGVGHEFHAELVVELYAAAAAAGYDLVLSGVTPGRSESHAVAELQSLRCDALVLLGPTMAASDLAALARSTPTVTVARAVRAAVGVVRTDDVAGAALATRHLLELGHRRIVHVDGGRAPGAAERRRGYRRAMHAAGLADLVDVRRGGLAEEDGQRAARALLATDSSDRPTAAFVFNDRSAAGYLEAVREAGVVVPGEHSVVGFDDSHIARSLWAQLTTVGQDVTGLARVAVSRAVDAIPDGAVSAEEALLRPRLVLRRTTGHAPQPVGPGRSSESSAASSG